MQSVERHTIFFDFDSTLVSIESFDELLTSAIQNNPNQNKIIAEINEITRKGMEGEMAFKDSLLLRLNKAKINKNMFNEFSNKVKSNITNGMENYIQALQSAGHKVCILSGGFIDYIIPVAQQLNIPLSQVYANSFTFDNNGNVIGFDIANPLIQDNGKSLLIKQLKEQLKVTGKVVVIGDGLTDYNTFTDKQADIFIGCGIHIEREIVKQKADNYFSNINDLKNFLNSCLKGEN